MADSESSPRSGGLNLRAEARTLDMGFSQTIRALDPPRFTWMDPGGEWIVGSGEVVSVTASGPDRFRRVETRADLVYSALRYDGPSAARPRFLGGFRFVDGAPAPEWSGFGSARWVLPRVQVLGDGDRSWVTAIHSDSEDSIPNPLESVGSSEDLTGTHSGGGIETTAHRPARDDWEVGVRRALERIQTGAIRKVVLAGSLAITLDSPPDSASLLDRLADTYSDCYRFSIAPEPEREFIGGTPELLIRRRGDRIRTRALAGTVGRGLDPETDAALARELSETAKARQEHELVRDTIVNQLEPYTSSMQVGDRRVRTLENVQHLESPIRGQLAGDPHLLELGELLHPTPAVGGLPVDEALAFIRAEEDFDRGWYAAPIGWFDRRGQGALAVGIRSALRRGDKATLYAGNGIVSDSEPSAEWEELQLKYRPMLDTFR